MTEVFQKIDIRRSDLKNIYAKGSGEYKRTASEKDVKISMDYDLMMLGILVKICKGVSNNDHD